MTSAFICVTCRGPGGEDDRPGRALLEAIAAGMAGRAGFTVAAVECLSVCKRPCTVALTAPGKWTYVVGDLDAAANVDDVIDMATRYGLSADGIVPWRERPVSFRRGVVARIPPIRAGTAGI
jgi:predicted metal-binding protein